jgi:hypothetical protein
MATSTTVKRAAGSSAPQQPNGKIIDPDGVHHEYEFGGPLGVTAMMTFFPALFYYLYVCLFFYNGEPMLRYPSLLSCSSTRPPKGVKGETRARSFEASFSGEGKLN